MARLLVHDGFLFSLYLCTFWGLLIYESFSLMIMTTEVDNYPNLEKIFYDTIEWSISNILSNKIIYILLSILLIDHCILPLKMFLSLRKLLT